MSKTKSLDEIRKWKDLINFAKNKGLKEKRTAGGHLIMGNEKGSMPFSLHEKEPSKNLLHKVRKELKTLLGIAVVVLLFVYISPFI